VRKIFCRDSPVSRLFLYGPILPAHWLINEAQGWRRDLKYRFKYLFHPSGYHVLFLFQSDFAVRTMPLKILLSMMDIPIERWPTVAHDTQSKHPCPCHYTAKVGRSIDSDRFPFKNDYQTVARNAKVRATDISQISQSSPSLGGETNGPAFALSCLAPFLK